MTEPETGHPAPPFSFETGDGALNLDALKGKAIVLYFYPKDDTSGCTAEAIAFSAAKPEFENAGAVVIGVSPDSLTSHDKFRTKHGLAVALASDPDREAIDAYGVWTEKSMYGKKYMGVERSTFLIDPQGTIARIWRNVKVPGHVDEVLGAVREL